MMFQRQLIAAVRRGSSLRFVASTAGTHRGLSSMAPRVPTAQVKLINALETYRQENYGQTLFSRYIKEMVCAMDINDDKMISQNELATLLQSIGVKDVTSNDISAIMEQLGEGEAGNKQIHVQDVEEMILRGAQFLKV